MTCSTCGVEKAVDQFYAGRRQCKTCRIAVVNRRRSTQWSQDLVQRRAFRAANREAVCAASRARYLARRQEVIAAYGGQCTCCGETEFVFLAIDHVDNDGAQERTRYTTDQLINRIRKEGFPDRYQVLCHNCNWAKHNGGCPHMKAVILDWELAG